MDNDMLTLWLRARDGLPADQARDLVERLAAADEDSVLDAEEADKAQESAVEDAHGEGYREAHREIAARLRDLLEKHGEEDVDQTALWSWHNYLECEGREPS